MGERTARLALRLIVKAGLVEERVRAGETSVYRVTAPSRWVSSERVDELRAEVTTNWKKRTTAREDTSAIEDMAATDATPPLQQVQDTPARGAAKGNPL